MSLFRFCDRRALLCGVDRYRGKNFDHRKGGIRGRLEELARIVAVDMLGFSLMSNHLHLLGGGQSLCFLKD